MREKPLNSASDRSQCRRHVAQKEESYLEKVFQRENNAQRVSEWLAPTAWARVSGSTELVQHPTGLVARVKVTEDATYLQVLTPYGVDVPREAVEEFLVPNQKLPEATRDRLYLVWKFPVIP